MITHILTLSKIYLSKICLLSAQN